MPSRKAGDRKSSYQRILAIRGGEWGNTAERQPTPRVAITVVMSPVEREMIDEAMRRGGHRIISKWAREVLVAAALGTIE